MACTAPGCWRICSSTRALDRRVKPTGGTASAGHDTVPAAELGAATDSIANSIRMGGRREPNPPVCTQCRGEVWELPCHS